jgi:NADH-quinone oxidoreductase subunit M
MSRTRLAVVLVCGALAFLLAWGAPLAAHAATVTGTASAPVSGAGKRSTGRLVLSIPGQGHGPLLLEPKAGGWAGEVTLTNAGSEPLSVSRVAIRGDEDDVRSPPHITARFVEGPPTSATIPPGASRSVLVTWMPDKDPRMKQAFGHLVVTSSDEGAGESAMGFRAQIPRGLGTIGDHALTALVLLPLLGALVILGLRFSGRREPRHARWVALATTCIELGLTLWVYGAFSPEVTRLDGNDGLQFVERTVWIRALSVEWFVGVDGVSIALVLLSALVGVVGVIASFGIARRVEAYFTTYLVLLAAVTGVFVALDLMVLFWAWQVALVALVVLVAGWGGTRRELAATKLLLFGLVSAALFLVAIVAVASHADRTFLVDGAPTTRTLAIPELARVAFSAKGGTWLGLPWVEVAWLALFVACALRMPMVPLHTWLPDTLAEAPPGAAVVVGGVFQASGAYVLVRAGFAILP